MNNIETFKKLTEQKGKISCERLDEFFKNLDSIFGGRF